LGVLMTIGLNTPMRYWVNEKLRPWLLRDEDWAELLSRGAFHEPDILRCPGLPEAVAAIPGATGDDKAKYFMGYYGFQDYYYGFFRELSYTPLRYFPLVAIARTGRWDEAWFRESLARAGYSPTARDELLLLTKYLSRDRERTTALGLLRRLYRDGYLSDEEAEEELRYWEYPEDRIPDRIKIMRLEMEYDSRRDITQALCAAYRRGRLTDEQLWNMLITLSGMRPEKADKVLLAEGIRRYGGVFLGPMELPEIPERALPWEWEIEE